MTFLDALLITAAVASLLWVGFYAGRRSMIPRVREAATLFPAVTLVVEPTRELVAAREVITAQAGVIEILGTARVAPVSQFTELPWQHVPSPARMFRVQGVVDRVQDLEAELKDVRAQLAHMDWVRARHWKALKNLRAKVAVMVPAVIADEKADQFTRSLTVAKSAFGRAAELSTALSEIEVARFEATDLDTFNEAVESIYANHSLPITEPIGVVT